MSHPSPCPLQPIDSAVLQLQTFKQYLDGAFSGIQQQGQEAIDDFIINEVNPKINSLLANWRQSLLSCLQEMYKKYTEAQEPITTIAGMDATNLTSCIELVKKIKDYLVGAFTALSDFLSLFPSHIAELTLAITDIVTYTPSIPGVDFSKLDIKCEPITMQDITGES